MAYLSYSALSQWVKCPFKHDLIYGQKIRLFKGNIHTAFGKAVHETIEYILNEKIPLSDIDKRSKQIQSCFSKLFKREIAKLPDEEREKVFNTPEGKHLTKDMFRKGGKLSRFSVRQLHADFPGFQVLGVEDQIMEPIIELPDSQFNFRGIVDKANFDFRGYLDLAIKTPDGNIHIIDWKTTSWGWDAEKKSDKMLTYQLTFYKHFYSLKYDVDPERIQIHFGLVKRTAFTKNNQPKKDVIEIFEIKCGARKIRNALNVLNQAVYNIHKGNIPKNKLSCGGCEYRRTKWCP